MNTRIKYSAIGFALFFIFLVVKLPANQVLPRLPVPDNVVFAGISGSIWQGHAEQVRYSGLQLSNVKWELSALPLLLGKLSLDIKGGNHRDSEQIAINGRFAISAGGIAADNAILFAPTPLLLAQVQMPLPINASGRVKVVLEEFAYQQATGCEVLKGTGQWLNGAVAGFNRQITLGSFNASLACDNGPITVTTDPKNALNLTGTATVPHKGKISVLGKFKVSDDLPKEVHNAANFFGKPDANGFYAINL